MPPAQVHEQKEPSPGVQPKPGYPSGLPAQSSLSLEQHGVSWPPLNEFLHCGAWLAFGPHATTPTNTQAPILQTLSACHELLHGPPQWANCCEQGVPPAARFGQSGSAGPAPPLDEATPPVEGGAPPVSETDPPFDGIAPPLPETDPPFDGVIPPVPATEPPLPVAAPPLPLRSGGSPVVTPPQAINSAAANVARSCGAVAPRPMRAEVIGRAAPARAFVRPERRFEPSRT